jgi:long-chain acyl-CoA synthetase
VRQGYGLTETTGVSHAQWSEDPTSGNVGGPLPCIEFKLVDVPDMNYFAKDVKGEICLRGPNIFKGYYKAQDKTDEVLTKDGWFHTGDIGQILPNGTLAIVDRKKNIFKLSQGEYVAAEKIENTYLTCKWVQQVFVYGDSTQSALVAVVVPDAEVLKPWAAQNNIDHADDLAALCKNDQVKQMILNDMTKDGKAAKLRGFEFVKAIHLEPTPFSIENDLLTPTFKLKRPQLKNHYTQTIADMYTEVNAQAPSPSQ